MVCLETLFRGFINSTNWATGGHQRYSLASYLNLNLNRRGWYRHKSNLAMIGEGEPESLSKLGPVKRALAHHLAIHLK